MRKNWPYFIVASFLNAVLITGAFIEFKLRGIAGADIPALHPTRYEINPLVFTGGIFLISFLVIMGIIIIKDLVGGISKKLHSFNESLATPQPGQLAIDNGQ